MIKIRFENKNTNTSGKGFLIATNIYMNPNDATILIPKKQEPEKKPDVNPEYISVK